MTAQAVALARSAAEIRAATREASCGECGQVPGVRCAQDPDGDHVARFGRAARTGLISGAELVAILRRLEACTTATIVETSDGGLVMSPRASHPAGQQPADQPWARTSDRNVWRASNSSLVLTVTHLVTGGWQADIEGPGVTRRSPVLGSRGAAQAWADDRARGVS